MNLKTALTAAYSAAVLPIRLLLFVVRRIVFSREVN